MKHMWTVCWGGGVSLTLDVIVLEDPEEPGGHEAKLPLAGVREGGHHLRHGGLPPHAGQAVVVGEEEPVGMATHRQWGQRPPVQGWEMGTLSGSNPKPIPPRRAVE